MDDKDIHDSDSSTEDQVIDETGNDDAGDSGDDTGDDKQSGDKKNADSRINELVGKNKQLEEQVAELRRSQQAAASTSTEDKKQLTPDAQKAVEYLKGLGFQQKTDVEAELKQIQDRIALDNEHTQLSLRFDGEDGRPQYDKDKVEDYMRKNGIFNPEAAYKLMHETELLDWNIKGQTSQKKKPYIEKPGGTGTMRGDNTITREKLQEVAANPTPANRAWYEQNRPKILSLMAEGKL